VADIDSRAVRNLVHCSGNAQEAEGEVKLWFKPDELIEYRLINEAMLYDTELGNIL
jgi:hypothetical protein